MEFLKNPNFDFLGKTRYFVGASVLVVLAGVAYMLSNNIYLGKNPKGYGVEFSGGTQLIVKFQNPPQVDRIRSAVEQAAPGAVIQTYDKPEKNQVLIRLAGAEETDLGATAERVKQALATATPRTRWWRRRRRSWARWSGRSCGGRPCSSPSSACSSSSSTSRSASRARSGAPRPPWPCCTTCWSPSAFLALFRYEITLNVIAALLTLVGYSVNDTIVIFDRAREILRHNRKDPLRKILNDSVNLTLTRTLISNGTTFLSVLALFLFGGEVLRGFGFTMVIGILVGTYSTIYIASPLVAWWSNRSKASHGTAAKAAAI